MARRGGLLALEPQLRIEKSAYERKGLQLLIDGAEPAVLREILERDIQTYEDEQRAAIKVWDSAGGYAPTIGILGAVLGLIHVMENLTDPTRLGAGIAVAFVATLYGVGTANLVFLPIAQKLKGVLAREVRRRELLIDGLVSVAHGENPRIIQGKLEGFPDGGGLMIHPSSRNAARRNRGALIRGRRASIQVHPGAALDHGQASHGRRGRAPRTAGSCRTRTSSRSCWRSSS